MTYLVYLDKQVGGLTSVTREIDVPDNYTEIERDAVLQTAVDMLIDEEIQTGWYPKLVGL